MYFRQFSGQSRFSHTFPVRRSITTGCPGCRRDDHEIRSVAISQTRKILRAFPKGLSDASGLPPKDGGGVIRAGGAAAVRNWAPLGDIDSGSDTYPSRCVCSASVPMSATSRLLGLFPVVCCQTSNSGSPSAVKEGSPSLSMIRKIRTAEVFRRTFVPSSRLYSFHSSFLTEKSISRAFRSFPSGRRILVSRGTLFSLQMSRGVPHYEVCAKLRHRLCPLCRCSNRMVTERLSVN